MSSQLTVEQQRKIEENRRRALERRAQRQGQTSSSNTQTSVGFSGASGPVQPSRQSGASDHAARHRPPHALSSASAREQSASPFKTDSTSFNDVKQGHKHQQPSSTCNQLKQSTKTQVRCVLYLYMYLLFCGRKKKTFCNSLHCLSM